jgi:hypothetical protein
MRIRIVVSADPATWGRGRDTQAAAARLAALCGRIARRDYPGARIIIASDSDASRATQRCGVDYDPGEATSPHRECIVEDIITEAYETYDAVGQPWA